MTDLPFNTSRNVTIDYALADASDRIVATILDILFQAGYVFFVSFIIDRFTLFGGGMLLWLGVLSPIIFYDLVCEITFGGRTLGKSIMKIQVVKMDGSAPSVSDFLIRWLIRIVEVGFMSVASIVMFPGLIALISISVSKTRQRLGDLAADTIVIKRQSKASLRNTIYIKTEAGYEVAFPQVRELTDRDVSIIKEVFDKATKHKKTEILYRLADRICKVLEIQTDMRVRKFLLTVLKDYNYIYGSKTVDHIIPERVESSNLIV